MYLVTSRSTNRRVFRNGCEGRGQITLISMYQATKVTFPTCTAHVTINRNRAKIYRNSIYLKNGQKFEIELFNPTTSRVLAKISLNGKLISDAGIILRPGERVYLERYIDTNNKFIFETYEVGKTKEALAAIQNNGLVEISFYSETIPLPNLCYSNTYNTNIYNPPVFTPYPDYNQIYCSSGITGNISNNGASGTLTVSSSSSSAFYSPSNVTYSCNDGFMPLNEEVNLKSSKDSKSIETGIVGKGEYSNQGFNQVFGDFNRWASKTITYKILPESQKPVEYSSLRNYCPSCGTRIKKPTWKFCPNCGKNLK